VQLSHGHSWCTQPKSAASGSIQSPCENTTRERSMITVSLRGLLCASLTVKVAELGNRATG
jgi:hypothetical protein